MPDIATGLWIDHSRSPAIGATLTIRNSYSNALLSALTVVVTVALSSLWRLVTFYLHHRKAAQEAVDLVDLQHQVLLRNSASIAESIFEFIKLYYTWTKHRPRKLLRRTICLLFPALVIFTGFLVSSILVSRVSESRNLVGRMVPNFCGDITQTESPDHEPLDHEGYPPLKIKKELQQAKAYVSEMYLNTSTLSNPRSIFKYKKLPYYVSTTAACPFPDATSCTLGPDGAFSMISGQIDSHEMPGINAPREDRISFQVNMTCSPLRDPEKLFSDLSLGDIIQYISDHAPIPFYNVL